MYLVPIGEDLRELMVSVAGDIKYVPDSFVTTGPGRAFAVNGKHKDL